MGKAKEDSLIVEAEKPNECVCQGSVEPEPKNTLEVDQVINLDEVKPNSIIALRIKGGVDKGILAALQGISDRYGERFRKDGISVLLLADNLSLEVVDEETMNRLGWHKKGKIITL